MRVLARQLTAEPAVMGTIVAAVFLSGLFLTATPLLFARLSDQALLEAVSTPQPQLRNITASQSTFLGASTSADPFARVRKSGESFRDVLMPESVRAIVPDMRWVVDSPEFTVDAMPGGERPEFSGNRFAGTLMRMRYQQDVDSHTSLVTGSMPQPHDPIVVELGTDCPLIGLEEEPDEPDCAETEVSVFEVAVTRETLEFLPIEVGEMLLLAPAVEDTAYFGIPREDLQYDVVVKISALIEIDGPTDDYWFNDPRLHRPRVRSNADFTFVFATGLMAPVDYRRLLSETGLAHWTYQWRYLVDPNRIAQNMIDELSADLANLQEEYPASTFLGEGHKGVNTKLPAFMADHLDRRNTTLAMMSTSIAGLFVVTVFMILMLSALTTERQRSTLLLLRNRGSSRVQMGVTRAAQGLLLSIPPAVLALVLSNWLISASSRAPGRLTVGLVAAATSFFVLAASPVIFRDLGRLQRREDHPATNTSRRLVMELAVAAVAVGAVIIVRRRGTVGVAGREPDLLLATAPALLALAVGLLVLRVYPHAISFLASLGSRRRGLATFVGFRRVLQQPAAARLPLMVMLVAVAVAAFASVTRSSINDAQVEATWHEAGAAFRLSEADPANALTGSPDPTSVESYEAHALGVRFTDASTSSVLNAPAAVDLLFLEVDNFAAVNAGTPADPHFPRFLIDPPSAAAGSEEIPIPAIASAAWDGNPPSLGDVFSVAVGGRLLRVEVREIRAGFPSMPLDRAFVVADIRHLDTPARSMLTRPTVMYVRADRSAVGELEEVVSTQTFGTILTAQAALFDDIHDERFTSGVDRSLSTTFWLAMILAAVAAVSSLALTAWIRKRDFGFLRTQGLTAWQAGWLTVIEQLPAIVVASVAGGLAGIGIALALEPAISLSAFSGSPLDPGLSIDPLPMTLLASGILTGLALLTIIFGYARRREDLGALLRGGTE